MFKKISALILSLCFLLGSFSGISSAQALNKQLRTDRTEIKNSMTKVMGLGDNDEVVIMVELDGETALEKGGSVKSSVDYQKAVLKQQNKVKKQVENVLSKEIKIRNNYTLLFNGFSFKGTVSMVKEINKIDGVTAFVAPTFDLPKTIASTELVNATQMWDLGYTGEGTAIAVLDTGIRETHEAFSVMPNKPKYDMKSLARIYEQYGEYMHSGSNINRLYYTEKIPFEYDYSQEKYGAEHGSSDHGTHVAGIAAGNNGKNFKGVAYDAQILAMGVFEPDGGALWDNVILALEDCAYLGVDSLNMSLGQGAGFSAYYEESYGKIFDLLTEAGVAISASAGNDNSTAENNAFGGYQLAQNPDSGIVGSPSTWPKCLSVASSDNATVCAGSIVCGDNQFAYIDPFADTELAFNLLEGTHEYIDCKFGKVEDFEGKDLNNKIALISRGDCTFTEKAANAINAGAKAVIIYNNQQGVINMSVESTIPIVSILKDYGDILVNAAEGGKGKLTVKNETYIDYTTSNVISSFSSKGTTIDLKIKPEITAPGGAVTSSVGFVDDSAYETWNGTSMSAPHVAAGLAVVKQYVDKKFSSLSAQKKLEIANAIIMSTATELEDELVRAQGSGLMNLKSAVTTNAYLTTVDGNRPKLELGEDSDYKFNLEFNVHNFGKESITYDVSTDVMIDCPLYFDTINEQNIFVTNYTGLDITEDCDINSKSQITVAAGKTVTVKVDVELHDDLISDIKAIYENGAFVEGFVTLTPHASKEGVLDATLSIPYLAFEGDWNEAAVFDNGYYWQDAQGETILFSNGVLPYNYIGSESHAEDYMFGAGINPYGDGTMPEGSFSYDRISVKDVNSVNYVAFSLLRNIKNLNLHVENLRGEILYYLYQSEDYQWKKEFDSGEGYTYSDLRFELDIDSMKENETNYIVLAADLGTENYNVNTNDNGDWKVPVTKDTTAPYMLNYSYKDKKLSIEAFDTMYIANIAVYSDAEHTNLLDNNLYYSDARGNSENYEISVDEKENQLLYISICDYAGNERHFIFNTVDNTMTEDIDMMSKTDKKSIWTESFENPETYSNWDVIDSGSELARWDIAENEEYAADGKRFAYSYTCNIDTGDVIDVDSWLISPPIDIPDDEKTYTLSFNIAATDTPESFELYYGNGDAVDVSEFYSIGEMQLDGSRYKTVEIDVTELAGNTVRFAWRHYNCSDGNFIRLDKISVYYNQLIPGKVLVEQGFESDENVWNTFDADEDGRGFTRIRSDKLASTGEYAMFSSSYDTSTWQNISADNWLISNKIKVPSEPSITYLNFEQISINDMNDYLEVYIGTESDISTMSKLYSENASGEWTKTTINISSYAGKTVYVAFRHHCDSGMMLGIDNVTVNSYDRNKEHTVRFVDKNNNLVAMMSCIDGEVISDMPAGRDVDGFAFGHWNYNNKKITNDITITAEYYEFGDSNLDCKVNTADAVAILRYSSQIITFTDEQYHVADVNRDGKVNTGDAVAILKKVVNM